MSKQETVKHQWQFRARFKRHAFSWRSDVPVQRIKEAISEISVTFAAPPLACLPYKRRGSTSNYWT